MVKETDFYERLGVDPSASEAEIRKAYKKRAVRLHPDKNKAPDAQEQFKSLCEAYEVLSDQKKRSLYDKYGEKGLKEGGFSAGDPSSLFESFFGGFGGGGGRRGPQRCDDIAHKLVVDLEDLYKGRTLKLAVRRNRVCGACSGNGTKSGRAPPTCQTCGGHGVVIATQKVGPGFLQRVQRQCPDCNGQGVKPIASDTCGECSGKKVKRERKLLEVYISKGMESGQRLTFRGEADEEPGMEAGDVVVVLHVRKHARFERDGDNLVTTARVPLIEALGGAVLRIDHLDGRELRVSAPDGRTLKPGETVVVRHEGMPHHKNPQEKGDLLVRIEVDMPDKSPSADVMKQLEKLIGGRRPVPIIADDDELEVEECEMHDYDEVRQARRKAAAASRREAYDDHDDDDRRHGHGPGGVQCAQQ